MRVLSSVFLSVLLAFTFILTSVQEASAQKSRELILAGYKHSPPVKTSGSGVVTVELRKDTLKVHGDFSDLTGRYSGAYIMVSVMGGGGNQLYRLKVNLNDEKTGGTLNAKENTFILTEAERELLKAGDLYINIATFENQSGEIMAKIPPM